MSMTVAYEQYRQGALTLDDLLAQLTDDTNPEFQQILSILAEDGSKTRSALARTLKDGAAESTSSYAAFVALATYYRRSLNHEALAQLLSSYRGRFSARPLFELFESLYYLDQRSPESVRTALRLVQSAVEKAPLHPGVWAAFADIVATGHEIQAFHDEQLIVQAIERIENATRVSPGYAKYYALRAKLALLQDDFGHARYLVGRALDLEDSNSTTYAVRVAEYQAIQNAIDAAEARTRFANELVGARREFQDNHDSLRRATEEHRIDSLSQLAFFAGIIAIIFSGSQFANNQSATDGALLLLVMSGTLMLAFGGFLHYTLQHRVAHLLPLIALGAIQTGVGITFLMFL